jgi:hypothetical protein
MVGWREGGGFCGIRDAGLGSNDIQLDRILLCTMEGTRLGVNTRCEPRKYERNGFRCS